MMQTSKDTIQQNDTSIVLSGTYAGSDTLLGFSVKQGEALFKVWDDGSGSIHFKFTTYLEKISLPVFINYLTTNKYISSGKITDIGKMLKFDFDGVSVGVDSEDQKLTLGVDDSSNTFDVLSSIGLPLNKLGFMFSMDTGKTPDFYLSGECVFGDTTINLELYPPINPDDTADSWRLALKNSFKPLSALATIGSYLQNAALKKIIGTINFTSLFPDSLTSCAITVHEIAAVFNPVQAKVSSLSIAADFTSSWGIGNLITLKKTGVDITIDIKDKVQVTTLVTGYLGLSNDKDIAVQVSLSTDKSTEWKIELKDEVTLDSIAALALLPVNIAVNELVLPDNFSSLANVTLATFEVACNPFEGTVISAKMALQSSSGYALIPSVLTVNAPALEISATNPFNQQKQDARAITGEISATTSIGGVAFAIKAEKGSDGWNFTGETAEGSKIAISKIIAALFKAVNLSYASELPDFSLQNVVLSYSSKSKNYKIAAASSDTWKIPLGVTSLSVGELAFTMVNKSGKAGGTIAGIAAIAGSKMSIEYDMSKGVELDASLPALSTKSLVDVVCGSDIWGGLSLVSKLPSLDFSNVKAVCDIDEKTIFISGTISGFGDAVFLTRKTNSKWGFGLGAKIGSGWKFASVSSVLALLDTLNFSNSSLVVTSFDDKKFEISDYPEFSGSVNKGVNFLLNVTMDDQAELKFIKKLLKLSIDLLKIHGSVASGGSGLIEASFDGDFTIANGVVINQVGLRITTGTTATSFGLLCSMEVKFKDDLLFTGEIEVEPNGASFSATMEGDWTNPFGIKGVTLSNVAIELGVNAEMLPSFGFAGTAKIKDVTGELGILVNTITPIESLLHLKFNELGIKTLLDICDESVAKSIPDTFDVIVNTGLKDVDVHIVPKTTSIGQIKYEQGFRASGALSLLGLEAAAALEIDQSSGLSGNGAVKAINLLNIFKVTGANGEKNPNLEINLNTKKVGVHLSGAVDFLGLTEYAFYADLTTSGFVFKIHQQLYGIVTLDLDKCTIDDKGFAATGGISYEIGSIGPISVAGHTVIDKIHINTGFTTDGSIKLANSFSFSFTGSLSVLGKSLTGITIAFSTPPVDFKGIFEVVLEKIKDAIIDAFLDIFKTVEEWATAIADGAVEFSGDVADVAKNCYNATIDAATAAYKILGKGASEVASGLKTAYGATAGAVTAALKGAGYAAGQVSDALKSAYNFTGDQAAVALKAAGYAAGEVGDALKSAYNFTGDQAAVALKAAGYAAGEVGDALKSAYGFTTKIAGKALEAAGYAGKEIKKWGGDAIDWLSSTASFLNSSV